MIMGLQNSKTSEAEYLFNVLETEVTCNFYFNVISKCY